MLAKLVLDGGSFPKVSTRVACQLVVVELRLVKTDVGEITRLESSGRLTSNLRGCRRACELEEIGQLSLREANMYKRATHFHGRHH